MERFIFPYLVYSTTLMSLYHKKIPVGYIYTMDAEDENSDVHGLNKVFKLNDGIATRIFGYSELLCSTDTYQFDDYSKYVFDRFDPA
ncbi:MAG: hypothetical protein QG610_876, partial [Euryarchaeota archaeon]|nr:hypothetical protein [Euryarchaeota archaeon]